MDLFQFLLSPVTFTIVAIIIVAVILYVVVEKIIDDITNKMY
jgi:hypothetical protein